MKKLDLKSLFMGLLLGFTASAQSNPGNEPAASSESEKGFPVERVPAQDQSIASAAPEESSLKSSAVKLMNQVGSYLDEF